MNTFIQIRQKFGTVQKQPGAPWQKISPPRQALQIYLPAQTVFEQAGFMLLDLTGI